MAVLAHKIRLRPTAKQQVAFACACGVARFTFNWALARWQTLYAEGQKPTALGLKREWSALKGAQYPWVYESPRDANSQAFSDLDRAFRNFFAGRGKYPRFKKKGIHDAFYVANDKFRLESKRVRLPVIGWVRMREALRFKGNVLSARVVREADQWHLAVQVELAEDLPPSRGRGTIGVDLGLTHLATLSTGEKIEHPKVLAHNLKRLQRLSRQLSRKQKGSKNREKAKVKLARLHLRIRNLRTDALHKLTSRLVHENQVVVAENLHVKGMVRNRHLSRAISDSGWSELRRQLVYKGELYRTEVVLAERFFPSSKRCSECGSVKSQLSLGDRVFACTECGAVKDRDHNAACNLEQYPGLQGNSTPVERKALAGSARPAKPRLAEAGTMPCSLVHMA